MTSTFPTSLDTFRQPVEDFIVLTLSGTYDTDDTDFIFNETAIVDGLDDFPFALVFYKDPSVEIVYATANPQSGHLTVTRAQEGTSGLSYTTGQVCTMELSTYYLGIMRDALLTAQKFFGVIITGAPAGVPANAEVRVRTDNSIVYYGVETEWKQLNRPAHGDYDGRDDVNDHPQYHNDARKAEWHSNDPDYDDTPGGSHITNPTTHSHDGTYGLAVKKLLSGTSLPTAQNAGDIFVKTDAGNVYLSLNGSTWIPYVSMPTGSLLYWESACPSGWTAQTSMNGKYLRGSIDNEFNEGTGGSNTHTHTLPTLITHSHTVPARSGTANSSGAHQHDLSAQTGSGGGNPGSRRSNDTGSVGTDIQSDNHSHTLTVSATNTASAGQTSPVTDSGASEPAYVTLILCRKD